MKEFCCAIAIGLLIASLSIADEPGAKPLPLPPDIAPPATTDREATSNPETLRKIQRALDGEPTDASGDEMLDDVIQIIRRRGSVLDGSVLDPETSTIPTESVPITDKSELTPSAAYDVQTAELLLKVARRLEASDFKGSEPRPTESRDNALPMLGDRGEGPSTKLLVMQMRRCAVTLLLQSLTPEPAPR